MSSNRSPESRHSKSRYKDRSRSRSRSPSKSERRRSRERQRKSRWHDDDKDERRDCHDDRKESRSSRKSRFSDTKATSWRETTEEESKTKKDRHDDNNQRKDHDTRSKQLSSITPGPILMFRNLASYILKEHLTQALGYQMSYIKEIRLINGRDNSSNYAFVEFYTTDDAVNWMEANKNGFEVRGCHVNVDFSHHRSIDGGDKRRKDFKYSDWNCFKCGTLNFSRRSVCLTCECSRTESDSLHEDQRAGIIPEMEAEEETAKNNPPSNVLIFRGLDGLSTEESIRKAISDVSNIKIKDIRLIRDKATNTSRRFCFVETVAIEEAAELNKVILEQHPAFFVDGRRINVSYARANTSLPKPANAVATAAIQQAQAMNMLTSTLHNQHHQHHYYSQNTTNTSDSVTTQPTINTTSTLEQSATGLPSTYLYDSTSGFYYDTITRLYYDPKTQYHYNSQTGQYCYYDNAKQLYIPVSADGTPITDNSDMVSDATMDPLQDKKKADISVASTGRSAKKIAKDMERWAKSVNTQKTFQQQLINQVVQSHLIDHSVQQDSTEAEVDSTNEQFGLQEAITNNSNAYVHVQAEEDTPSINVGGDMEYVDLSQLACLLCKRKFNSKEQLMKHVQISDLHKQNLDKLQSQTQTTAITQSQDNAIDQMLYRDRAKERRAKYGTDAIVPGWKKRFERERAKTVTSSDSVTPSEMFEQAEPENIGTKMLKAMGWNEGQGLGKEGQGIVKPIEAEKRAPSAGLGAPGSNYAIYSAGNDYRATLKSLTKARYDQTFDKND